jgi:hypothetical protein
MPARHYQHLFILKQDRALHQAVMRQRESTEWCINPTQRKRLKLVQQRQFHPVDIDMELASEMSDKWQGVLIKTTTEETDP